MKLTKKLFDSIRCQSTGGYLHDKDVVRPFIFRFPNKWEKRKVHVTSIKYWMFPHWFVLVVEEQNHFLACDEDGWKWKRPWENEKEMELKELKHGDSKFREFYDGRRFDSGELNSAKDAEEYYKQIIAEHFSDTDKYEIEYGDYGMSEIFYTKDGD